MNVSLRNTIFQQVKPAFLTKQATVTQKLAEVMNDKVDRATISDEAKQLLAKLREDQAVEKEQSTTTTGTFLQLAQQSLKDLTADIDTQLQNVDILESDTATAEEKAQARQNISYLEQVANVRGGIFTEDLLQKVAPGVALDNAPSDLLETNAKTLDLQKLEDLSPAQLRERLTAAKEQLQNKIAAFDAVTIAKDSTKLERVEEQQQEPPFDWKEILAQLQQLK